MNFKRLIPLCIAAGLLTCLPMESKTLERADTALQRLFPKSKIQRKNTVLSKQEQARENVKAQGLTVPRTK